MISLLGYNNTFEQWQIQEINEDVEH